MIKNLLYSLFLHIVLISAIYANFNLQYKEEEKLSEIVVSISIPTETAQAQEVKEEKPKEEAKPVKKEEEKKEEKKKKVKAEKKPKAQKKEVKKENIESPKKEFKKAEEEDKKEVVTKEPKQEHEEVAKTTEDKEEEEVVTEDKKNEELAQTEEEISNVQPPSNTIENLNLSAREKFNIQTQLRRCYRKAIEESKKISKTKLTVKATIDENGYINLVFDEEKEEETTAEYKIAIDNAKRAAQLCSPLRNLPLDKYYIWKEVTLQFDEDI